MKTILSVFNSNFLGRLYMKIKWILRRRGKVIIGYDLAGKNDYSCAIIGVIDKKGKIEIKELKV